MAATAAAVAGVTAAMPTPASRNTGQSMATTTTGRSATARDTTGQVTENRTTTNQAGAGTTAPAAATSPHSDTLLTHSIPVTGEQAQWRELVRLAPVSLPGGANRYVSARYQGRNASDLPFILQGAEVRCVRGGATSRSVYSNRNEKQGKTGTVWVHWMFHVPATGQYTCSLWGFAATEKSGSRKLDVLTGGLGMASTNAPDGAEWRQTGKTVLSHGATTAILRKTWKAGATRTRMGVDADVSLTHHLANVASSGATLKLYVTQLGSDQRPCRASTTATKSINIDHTQNHDRVYFSLRDLPISSAASCTRYFASYVQVTSTGANALDIEGTATGASGRTYYYTNGIAFSY